MAKLKKTRKTIDSWKKKRWHKIIAPKIFNEQVIGETPALEPNMLEGRTVSLSLMNLTRDIKKQGIFITFEVNKVMGNTAYTHVKAYNIAPPSIKRLVRRRRDRVDDSFVCTTLDGLKVRIKPFILTRTKTNNSVKTLLRKKTKEFLLKKIGKLPFEVLMKDIIFHKLQRDLRYELNNVHPMKSCEIRSCGLSIGKKKIDEVKQDVKYTPESEPERPQRGRRNFRRDDKKPQPKKTLSEEMAKDIKEEKPEAKEVLKESGEKSEKPAAEKEAEFKEKAKPKEE